MDEIDTIRLSQTAKDQLLKLKRLTGIEHWNILCRWALMTSLAENDPPAPVAIPADSNVEMSWKVFAGEYQETISSLISLRMKEWNISEHSYEMREFFRGNLHRGIAHLAALKGSVKEIVERH